MFKFSEEYDPEKVKLVNPWLNVKPDCKTQTGSDWYNIMLTASMGGKPVHGVAAPTCEVVCKSPDDANSETGVGFIRWDPTIMNNRPVIGHDLSDQFYTHHDAYKGTITASENTLAYESGLWEPSIRPRAKSTSLLAAGILQVSEKAQPITGISQLQLAGAEDSMLRDEETSVILSAAMTELEAEMCAPVVDPYEQAINSYPSASLAELYARVSGYTSFRDAFEQLGNAVYYIDTSDYVINARSILAHQTPDQPLSQKKRGYDSII